MLLKNIGTGVLVVGMTIANWLGVVPSDYFTPVTQEVETRVVHEYIQQPAQQQILGGTFQTPEVKALFTTSLASKITSSATSMTLVSATDKDGTSLASSTYGFIIDEGTSVEEFVLADCTGTTCTNMTRGISVSTATTSVAALQFEHRRGASVKITTAPSVVFLMNVVKGRQNIENTLRYSTHPTFNNSTDIIDRQYADTLSFGAVPAASETASGFVELATGLETASSTSSGSLARLSIPASLATSTYNSATAGLKVVVTQNNGKIDTNFLDGVVLGSTNNTFTGTNAFSTSTNATTTIGAFPAWHIGKQTKTFTANGTFTVPSGITKVYVRMVGGGGGGGGGDTVIKGGGGGAGGYGEMMVDVSATTSVGITIGGGGAGASVGTGATGGTTYFSTFFNCTGGTGGAENIGSGGVGGTCNSDFLNIPGGKGLGGFGNSTSFAAVTAGGGGASAFGGEGAYGGGGGGAYGTGAGDNGTAGIVVITW